MQVNMHEAKSKLSALVERALAGEEVIIAKAGVPVVRLTPVEVPKRKLGTFADKIKILDPDWDKPMTEEEFFKL